jgi:hypothetical protein
MWETDPRITTIGQAYAPLLVKAAAFPRPWSGVELRLLESDIQWLEQWFSSLGPDDSLLYSAGEKFGALLLCLGAELCREQSTEESVWPCIRGILPQSHPFLSELFLSNGQPSLLGKQIIVDSARTLNLRNAFDIEGTQQWFTTFKLQFGFTYRGAKSRLAEWLVGLGQPHAVRYLNGEDEFPELSSKSFSAVWTALRQLRQDRIGEAEAYQTLLKNPWVKPRWITDLLAEAQARIDILGRDWWGGGEQHSGKSETVQEDFCPIKCVSLDWKPGSTPRLVFDLDQDAIERELLHTPISELDFSVDGQYLCRWARQANGSWNGKTRIGAEPDSRLNQPNLSPKVLSGHSRYRETKIEWDFADSVLHKDVVVFDLDGAHLVEFGMERLAINRHYAILCDKDSVVQGCSPLQEFVRDTVSRQVVRLPVPLEQNISVAYKDFVLWQPGKPEDNRAPRVSIVLKTPPSSNIRLNDHIELIAEGVPDGAKDVTLLIHKKTYAMVQETNNQLKTIKAVQITPEFAAKQRRVRVKFALNVGKYTIEPRLSIDLLGVAMIRHKQSGENDTVVMEPLRKDDVINTNEGTKWLRIWTPGADRHTFVFEGNYLVGRVHHSKVSLGDIPGYGGECLYLTKTVDSLSG